MRLKVKPMFGIAAVAGAAAIAGIALLTLPAFNRADDVGTVPSPVTRPAPIAPQPVTPLQADEAQPENQNVSPPADESPWAVTNDNLIDLISGTLLARERDDRAWLARTLESTAGRPGLVEDDLHAAHRQFLWRSAAPMWLRISQAWQERSYEIIEDGDNAELVMQVGGALGELRIKFVRIADAWYFAGI